MSTKRKELLKSADIGYLPPYVFEDTEINIKKIKKKTVGSYYIFVASLSLTVAICVCFLFFVRWRKEIPSFAEELCSEIAWLVESMLLTESDNKSNHSIKTEGILSPSKGTINDSFSDRNEYTEKEDENVDINKLYDFDYSKVPSGEIPIIPMDLSLSNYGDTYINNDTGLTPDTSTLLTMDLKNSSKLEFLSASSAPTVLIVHTHGTEAYCEKGAVSYNNTVSDDIARSSDISQNVVEVGRILSEELNKRGISNIHCEIMHDADEYRNAYARCEETIRYYLKKYPTIKLVIDVHRDAIINSKGEIIRPVTAVDKKASAQVMCVVGSSWGGQENAKWERNLALALQLRKELNKDGTNICRPPYLKSSTYNQEIAPYSLLLEIGACGNSIEEACNAAKYVAEALSNII